MKHLLHQKKKNPPVHLHCVLMLCWVVNYTLIPQILISINWEFQIIEFVSVLVSVSSEAAEKELIRLGAVKRILELFFE